MSWRAHSEALFILAICVQLARTEAVPHGLCDTDKDCMKAVEYCEMGNETRGLCMCLPDHGLNSESSMCEKSKPSFDAFYIAGPEKVELPTKAVVLEVKFNRTEDETGGWGYAWELLLGTGLGYVDEYDKRQLVITELMPGRLRVLVKISNATMEGHASHTLTVSPRKVNISPKAVIKPPGPIFVLAESAEGVTLDGSASIDFDGKIVKYEWAVRKGTPPKQLPPMNTPMVKLAGLPVGNNSIQLTVVDDRGARDTAEVNVLVRTSAPPRAQIHRCGEAANENATTKESSITVRLPMQQLYLCGNSTSSAVDEVAAGVLSYTWARIDNLHNLPLDYTGTTTPMLRLSNLHATNDKIGPYEFRLKVTDVKQRQSNVDVFSVHVRERVLPPPEVNAGGNQTVVLPNNSAVLEGTVKTDGGDGVGTAAYTLLWELLSGPNKAVGGEGRQKKLKLINKDHLKASVVGLDEGLYQFRFNVVAAQGGTTSSAVTFLNVVRGKDAPPMARAENATVVLPKNFAMLNGSGSTDDTGITTYKWRPLEYVPASLTILGDSASEPNLLLTNLIEGRYLFNLTVWDVSQKSHSTIAELLVRAGPEQENGVQLYLRRGVRTFSTRWKRKLADRLSAALAAQITEADTVQISYTGVVEDPSNGYAVVTFYATYVPVDEPQLVDSGSGSASSISPLSALPPAMGVVALNSTLTPTTPSVGTGSTAQQPPDLAAKRIVYAPRVVEILRRDVVIVREFDVAEITAQCWCNRVHWDCFLDCNGHGTCSNYSKQCECDAFWMSNIFRRLQTGRREDCEWSLLYVWLLLLLLFSPPLIKLVQVASTKLNDWLFPVKAPVATPHRAHKPRHASKLLSTTHPASRRSTRRSYLLFSPLAARSGSATSSGGGRGTGPAPPASGLRVDNVPGQFSPPPPTRGKGILASSSRKFALASSSDNASNQRAGGFIDIPINSTSGLDDDDTDDTIFSPVARMKNKPEPFHARAQLHTTAPETQEQPLLDETYQSVGH